MRAMPLPPNRRIVVLGDYMLDAYVNGDVRRVCPDAPAPVLEATDELWAPGGAGNVAVGCTAHGLEVVACGFTGKDPAAQTLETLLAEAGVGLDGLIAASGRATLVKRRFCAGDHVILRVDEGTTAEASRRSVTRLAPVLQKAGAVVVSDYGYGAVTAAVLEHLSEQRSREPIPLLIDAKRLERYRSLHPDVVKPNYAQFCELLGLAVSETRTAQVRAHAAPLLDATGPEQAIVTLDADGCIVVGRESAVEIPAPPVSVRSTSGAGDSFLVALVAALFSGVPLIEAAGYATRTATAACTRQGTVSIARQAEEPPPRERHKRVAPGRVAAWAKRMHSQNRRVVLTNGCFDVFHAGHAEFLQRAADAGDALLVAVNTDDSVRDLKGSERPVNTLEDRLRVLEAIGVVTAVTWFDDPTAEQVARRVRPDAYVKGSDYYGESFPEAEFVRSYGGRVVFVDLLDGRSTTRILERVRSGSEVAV